MPVRIQRRRTKGWRTPRGTIYVGRPTRWGNPFVVGRDGTAEECVAKYRAIVEPNAAIVRNELGGHNLSCWCPVGSPCHADVLLELANR